MSVFTLYREREQGPRFCPQGSFEFDIGNKWKELYQNFRKQEENLKRQFDEAAMKLEFEMENAAMEHQTAMLRQGKPSAIIVRAIFIAILSTLWQKVTEMSVMGI